MTKPIPYGRQHITDEDIQAVIETLQSDYLTQGPKILEFEQEWRDFLNFLIAKNSSIEDKIYVSAKT